MKNYILILLVFFAGVFLVAKPVCAEEEEAYVPADDFQQSLHSLRESVERLSSGNTQLTQRNNAVKQQIHQLQQQLNVLNGQGEILSNEVHKLKDEKQSRQKAINEVHAQIASVNDSLDKVAFDQRVIQEAVDRKQAEDDSLTSQLNELKGVDPAAAMAAPIDPTQDDAKEKLRLMKMIYESKERQEQLHERVVKVSAARVDTDLAKALAKKKMLNDEVGRLMAASPQGQENLTAQEGAAQEQVLGMEKQLVLLQKNYEDLQELVERLQKRGVGSKVNPVQKGESEKLENNIADLRRQGEALKGDLDDLRSQMVELDKRKASLESLLRQ